MLKTFPLNVIWALLLTSQVCLLEAIINGLCAFSLSGGSFGGGAQNGLCAMARVHKPSPPDRPSRPCAKPLPNPHVCKTIQVLKIPLASVSPAWGLGSINQSLLITCPLNAIRALPNNILCCSADEPGVSMRSYHRRPLRLLILKGALWEVRTKWPLCEGSSEQT